MFFIHKLERPVTVHPSWLGHKIRELVKTRLCLDIEGTCAGDFHVIAVLDSSFEVSGGIALPGLGLIEYRVKFRALVWRTFKGEVVRTQSSSPSFHLIDGS